MATDSSNEFQKFNDFVSQQLAGRDEELSLEESVAAFRAYQAELARCREELQPPIDELDTNGGTELDIDAIIARGRRQLEQEGILD